MTSRRDAAALAGGNCAMSASSRVTAVVATATVSTFSAVNLERTYRRGIVKSAYSGQLIGVGVSGLKTRKED